MNSRFAGKARAPRTGFIIPRLAALLLVLGLPVVSADVVRRAPQFAFSGATGARTLAGLNGQPVVLLFAKSAKTGGFRKQLNYLRAVFPVCASRGTVFAAAITANDGAVPSDIPFVNVANAQAVAAAYGMRGDFLIAVIGPDGNLDFVTDKVQPGLRLVEVINNSFEVQNKVRREIPKGPPGR